MRVSMTTLEPSDWIPLNDQLIGSRRATSNAVWNQYVATATGEFKVITSVDLALDRKLVSIHLVVLVASKPASSVARVVPRAW